MISSLPVQVLGVLSPILSLVEGAGMLRERSSLVWNPATDAAGRERAWLGTKLPSASFDVLDAVVEKSLPERAGVRSRLQERLPLDPGGDYDLVHAFQTLANRYFCWSGRKLVIEAGKMEELHELARIFPVGQIARHRYAQALFEGSLPLSYVLELPLHLHSFDTANRSLQVVVQRGLAEGHMHLWGVTGTEEVWADHLLGPRLASGFTSRSSQQIREDRHNRDLQEVSRLSMRLLAAALVLEQAPLESTFRLRERFNDLDHILVEHRDRERVQAIRELQRESGILVRKVLEHLEWQRKEDLPEAPDPEMVLYLLEPAYFGLYFPGRRFPTLLTATSSSRVELRARALAWLHLKVHAKLLRIASNARGGQLSPWEQVRTSLSNTRHRSGEPPFQEPGQELLRQAFFRYLLCQTLDHQHGTQPRRRHGLREFRRYFEAPQRSTVTRDERQAVRSVLRRLFEEERIKILEGRVSHSRGGIKVRPWLMEYARLRIQRQAARDLIQRANPEEFSALQGRPRERVAVETPIASESFGIVVHFIRSSGNEREQRRFQRARRKVQRQAIELFEYLLCPDPAAPFIVGIDVANLEYGTEPPEVFAPAFRFLRQRPIGWQDDRSFRRHFVSSKSRSGLPLDRRLALTYHVGEDFAHILSGLRAIDEAIEFLAMRPGDRLGHAIALGIDPEKWAGLIGHQTMLPQLEWLDTLVWVRHILGSGHDLIGELEIEDTIRALGTRIYGGIEVEPLALLGAWFLRQLDPEVIITATEHEIPHRRIAASLAEQRWWEIQNEILLNLQKDRNPSPTSIRLALAYQGYDYDIQGVQERGEEQIELSEELTGGWLKVIRDIQARMQRKVHDRHLVVEVNPSSNLSVGAFRSVGDHHVFTLAQEQADAPVVLSTINSDDPGVFQTCLAHEYYLLGEALLRKGVPESKVMDWLEMLRRNGYDYSFLVDLSSLQPVQIDEMYSEITRFFRSMGYYERYWLDTDFLKLR